MLLAFPNCYDGCPPAQEQLWDSVRSRPDAVQALMTIARDPRIDRFTRGNAILRAANSGQAEAYRAIIALWSTLPPKDGLLQDVSITLARGRGELPLDVYARIESFLRDGNADNVLSATGILAARNTAISNEILKQYRAGASRYTPP